MDHDSSPLFKLRLNNREDAKLNEGILVLLRFLGRIPISEDIQLHINHNHIDQFVKQRRLIKQFYSSNDSKRSLKRTMTFIELNDGLASLENSEVTADKNQPSKINIAHAIEDALLLNYLLLDSASVWSHLRFENSLNCLEMLCMTWSHKCNDIFDSCFELLQNYWTR